MGTKTLLVTGSSGLIGSEVSVYFAQRGWKVHGVDNNKRAVFFGPAGDTLWNRERVSTQLGAAYTHHELDIRDRTGISRLVESVRPAAIIHAAAQPSHDRAAAIPFDDFETNAVGTLNLREGLPLCIFFHEQGLWRPSQCPCAARNGHPLGIQRPSVCRRHCGRFSD